MRRDIGLILAGLGTFLIVLAVAIPTVLVGQLLKFPLNYYYVATLHSPSTTYYSPCSFNQVSGANVTATYTIKGAPGGTSSTAVWDQFSSLVDNSANCKIQLQERQFAFDRKNATLVNCCGHNISGTVANESGIAGDVWPMNVKKQTYDVFDTTLLKPVPFTYAGTDTVDGVPVYKFQEIVQPTKIGFSPLSSTQPEYYAINLTYWVDPETGALLKVNEHQQEYLVDPVTGAQTATLFDGTLSPDAPSIQAIVNIDNSGRLKIMLFTLIIPLVSGILGLILLLAGIWMYLRGRQPDVSESGYDAMTRELAASVAESRVVAATSAPVEEPAASAGEGHEATQPSAAQPAPEPAQAEAPAPAPAKRSARSAAGRHAAGAASGNSEATSIVPGMDGKPSDAPDAES